MTTPASRCAWGALLSAALLMAAGCSGGHSAKEPSPTVSRTTTAPTRTQDVAWVVLLRKWEERMSRRGSHATGVADGVRTKTRRQAELDVAVRPLERCAESLDREVGPPLVPRYRESYGLFRTACSAVAAWGTALDGAAGSGDGERIQQVDAKEAKVGEALGEAQRELESSFLAVQPLPIKGGNVSTSRIEPRFGRAMNKLVYKREDAAQIEVRCWSKEDWPKVKYEWGGYAGNIDFAGFAYDQFRVSVAPDYCASLVELVYEDERPTSGLPLFRAAASVALLAHEAGHLFESETNEARTECYAVQRVAELGRILGLGREYSDELARVYWEDLYPRNPPAYKTELCRNGGPLDLRPNSDSWP
jgi:hypothetical protein